MSASYERNIFSMRTLLVGDSQGLRKHLADQADTILNSPQLTIPAPDESQEPLSRVLAKQIAEHRPQSILIAGGDGTINATAEALLALNASLPCRLIPTGTANDLARTLAEIRLSNEEPSCMIDIIRARLNDETRCRCCVNMFTLGTSARNMDYVTTEVKERWGAFAYLSQFWQTLADLVPLSLTMQVGRSEPLRLNGLLNAFVANGPTCGGGFRIAPEANLADGRMNAVLLREGTATELTGLTAAFLAGIHLDHKLVEHFAADQIVFQSPHPIPITLDGERAEAQRIELSIVPQFLAIDLWKTE
ncbi:MAG: diacylglycerol kinase family protein [Pirellulales bacterium]